ncbi:MAG: trigger factor [Erysipelotrichaceae bacterium]|nr:trigger factor [Erysipelotrichaceae bacterium]
MSEFKKLENAKAELTCTLEGETWQNARKSAFNKLASKLEIKGFRKGQAPRHLAEKYISNNEVLIDAAESLAQLALNDAVDEHDVTLIDRPELKLDELTDDKCVMSFVCPVLPDVTVKDYKKLNYKVEEVKVEDKEVQDEIANLLNRKADLELKEDGEVEDGDTAVIDYEGFLDGVPFEGGKDENHDLVIGSNTFIPGFEEQLLGMRSEETKEIEVNFPEDYHAEELKGKPAKFVVTVHEIKKKVLPELNDEFVKELKIDGVETVDQLNEYTKSNMLKRRQDNAEKDAEQALIEQLAEKTEVDIPEVMINSELDSMVQTYESNLMQQGLGLQQFLQFTNQTVDQLKDSLREDAIKRIKTNLALSEISKLEDVKVNDEDIQEEYRKMSEMYSMPVEDIEKYVPRDSLTDDLKLQKTLDLLKNK